MDNLEQVNNSENIQPAAIETATDLSLTGGDQKTAVAQFDKHARQIFSVEGENSECEYRLAFAVESLEDEDLFQYDRLSEMQVTQDGKNQLIQNNTLIASRWFFNNRLKLIDGFEGELPANWQSDFTDDEKQSVVDALLDSDIYVEDEGKAFGKRRFGVQNENVVIIKAAFNGVETLLHFDFPVKTNQQVEQFRKITVGSVFKKGQQGRFVRPTWQRLCEMYESIGVKCSDGNPAAHLKVLAMRERFDAVLQKNTKKQSR